MTVLYRHETEALEVERQLSRSRANLEFRSPLAGGGEQGSGSEPRPTENRRRWNPWVLCPCVLEHWEPASQASQKRWHCA
jgi:hypothetical protein